MLILCPNKGLCRILTFRLTIWVFYHIVNRKSRKNDIFTKIINLNPSTWSLRSKNRGLGGFIAGSSNILDKDNQNFVESEKNRGIIYYAVSSDEIVAHLTGQAARSCGSENEEDICVLVGCSGIFYSHSRIS